MPRRKPASAKQRKADLQLKRAIKRGDVPAPQDQEKSRKSRTRTRRGPTGHPIGKESSNTNQHTVDTARKLQSSFINPSPQFLAEAKELASALPLPRPIPSASAVFVAPRIQSAGEQLTCPKRPKWRYDMTKKEVEKNEEGLFAKWLTQTDSLVEEWRAGRDAKRNEAISSPDEPGGGSPQRDGMPSSLTYFERNLEVWRQLWRVTELSQIILVLLDSRCPPLHFPSSLSEYLEAHSSGQSRDKSKKIVLVLTKVDISGAARANTWETYLRKQYPHVEVVQVESYYVVHDEVDKDAPGQKKKKREARLPQTFRERLVGVLKQVHEELLRPPERIQSDPDRLAKWQPPVRRIIDWDAALRGVKDVHHEHREHQAHPEPEAGPKDEADDDDETPEPEYLTIGLIGQPNVGKSSLVNALFGESKVRASKTPGKTKHFQTLFLTPDIRFVDCPGLVMPSYVPMELQVLSGILPISHISSIPSCIHYAASVLPLEQILKLNHPASLTPQKEDKRTWRDGMQPQSHADQAVLRWTAMDILTAYANYKGWVTAKAGRPDVMRAGNAILRLLAEGRIRWAFLPPLPDITQAALQMEDGDGIWIRDGGGSADDSGEESDEEEGGDISADEDGMTTGSDADSEDASSDAESEVHGRISARFGVLALGDEQVDYSSGKE